MVLNDLHSPVKFKILSTRLADFSRKECDKRILGRIAEYGRCSRIPCMDNMIMLSYYMTNMALALQCKIWM